ncbi:MAG: hypothetical protein HFJ01_12075 [Lachnospiraceae bacterium]|nr:hypothetical protein [Lachnospiraceae bacterium]
MYLYEKKIVYLSLLEDGLKKASVGFARVSREKDTFVLDIHIKNEGIFFGRKYSLFLIAGGRKIEWGTITGQHGRADVHRSFGVRDGIVCLGEKFKGKIEEEELKEENIQGISIRLDGRYVISGYWQENERNYPDPQNAEISAADIVSGVGEDSEKRIISEKIPLQEPDIKKLHIEKEREDFYLQPAAGDKWEELQRTYKKVHPFGDERVFLSIELKDFIVLQAPYQRLANNSFLLHGFYNYRHMILGPDKELGGDGNCYYLGVPGTYFEREKMVAIMFGFEGFECDGAVEIGKFGYYMRRVEL